MNIFLKTLSIIPLFHIILTSCGGAKPKGNGGFERSAHSSKKVVTFDLSEIETVDKDLNDTLNEVISWSLRLLDPEENVITDLRNISFPRLSDELRKLTVSDVLYVVSEVSAYTHPGILVAANRRHLSEINSDIDLAGTQCPQSESGISFLDRTVTPAVIKLHACQFPSTSEIVPADYSGSPGSAERSPTLEKPKTISYKCNFSEVIGYSDGTMTTYGRSRCTYGYDPQPGETMPELEVPNDYAPGTPLYLNNILNFEDISFKIGRAGQIAVSAETSSLPFGSIQSCHSLKINVKMATNASTTTHRLDFFRSGIKGADTWTIKETATTPKMIDLAMYYRESKESLTAYLICTWIPSSPNLPTTKI